MPLRLSAFLATIFYMLNGLFYNYLFDSLTTSVHFYADVFMSLTIVTEKPERDIMLRPPSIRSKDHLLNLKLLIHAYMFVGSLECFTVFFCSCYYWIDNSVPFYSFTFTYERFNSDPPSPYSAAQMTTVMAVAQSVYYCFVCLFQFFNYFTTRTRYASILEHNPFWGKGRNWYMLLAMGVSAGVQLIITQIVWFNQVFGTGAVPVKYVMPTLEFGMLWLVIEEVVHPEIST